MTPAFSYQTYNNRLWSTTPTITSSSVWNNLDCTTAGTTADSTIYWTQEVPIPTTISSIVWWDTQPAPTIYRRERIYTEPERIYRPAVIRRRTVSEHARETIQRVDAVRDANEVKRRARRLLLSHLTPEQRQTFTENGWFIVEGGKSRQRYRIRDKNYAGNIDVLEGERVSHRLCCHASAELPVADHLLAQKIMLEIAEDDFLRLANRHAA